MFVDQSYRASVRFKQSISAARYYAPLHNCAAPIAAVSTNRAREDVMCVLDEHSAVSSADLPFENRLMQV